MSADDIITEGKFEIKANKIFCLKKAYFWCTLIQAVEVKLHGFFKNTHLMIKYLLPEKISLLTPVWQKAQPFKG